MQRQRIGDKYTKESIDFREKRKMCVCIRQCSGCDCHLKQFGGALNLAIASQLFSSSFQFTQIDRNVISVCLCVCVFFSSSFYQHYWNPTNCINAFYSSACTLSTCSCYLFLFFNFFLHSFRLNKFVSSLVFHVLETL